MLNSHHSSSPVIFSVGFKGRLISTAAPVVI